MSENNMHEFYPIEEDKIVKDKGLESFEVMVQYRKVVIKRCYVIQDPDDPEISIKKNWRDVIDYRRRDDLKNHFKEEDIQRISEAIWDADFIAEFEAKEAARENLED